MGLPAIEKIKEWDGDELLKWIQDNRKKALKGDTLEKFKAADIDGATFLKHAGKKEYFREECNLPIGTSGRLADLASEMAQEGKEQDTTSKSTDHAPLLFSFTLIHITADPKTRKRKSLPDTGIVPSPKRTRVGKSSLIINSELEHFRSGPIAFSNVLQKEGQAYFDRTRYIFKLHKLDNFILFCRPRRFGKSLTVSMLEHFHGLQYAGEHQSLYKVYNNILNYLDVRIYFSFNLGSRCAKRYRRKKSEPRTVLRLDIRFFPNQPQPRPYGGA
jgi:hypothetical protein